VPAGSLLAWRVVGVIACTLAVALPLWTGFGGKNNAAASAGLLNQANREVKVLPGDTSVERGTSLVITAEFASGSLPESTKLQCVTDEGRVREVVMKQNLSDPVFGGFLARIEEPLTYQVLTEDWTSEAYTIDVFEFPEVLRSDAHLTFPDYTEMDARTVEDTIKVSVVQGAEVVWKLNLNKAVASCSLFSEAGLSIDCDRTDALLGGRIAAVYEASIVAEQTSTYEVKLRDDEGRENKYPLRLTVKVLPNRPPKLKLEKARDVTVSALQELPLRAAVNDDYGVQRAGISYSLELEADREVELASTVLRGATAKLEHELNFEELGAKPDDLVSFYFWAEDVGPNGEVRRTQSDMYFADVRPFEQIFRPGEQPPGGQQQQQGQGQQGQGQQAEELAELQKQIVNAIWKLVRRKGAGMTVSDEDLQVVSDSQLEAAAKLEELKENLEDDVSIRIGESITTLMENTIESLGEKRLDESLVSAKGSYAALMKLRAREFQVSRSQQQQQSQGSSAQQNRRQQLDELELDAEENRYETQQQAQQQTEQQQAAAEARQVLSRLRELAQRAEDLNEELAKLQTALEQAETEEEEEEIRRRLKRLREQQQELLRQADDLESRMRSEENAERMSEQADQLQQSRSDLSEAAKATEQNDPSAALASGRRAEESIRELEEEFKRESAGAFDEQIRQMQREAQDLEAEQEKIGRAMREQVENASPGLRGEEESAASPDDLEKQAERFRELMDSIEQTTREAEDPEPLLAERLYDAFREATGSQADLQLDNAAELVRRGFTPQAEQFEQEAAKGIRQLREKIDEAADSVLGDSTEGLRRAAESLQSLAEGVEDEIARETGRRTGRRTGSDSEAQRQRPNEGDLDSPPSDPRGEPSSRQGDTEPQDGDSVEPANERQQSSREREQDTQQRDGERAEGEQRQGQEGESSREGQQPPGQQPGEGPPQEPGDQPPGGQQPGGQQPGGQQPGDQQPGGQQPGEQPGESQQPGQQPGTSSEGTPSGGRQRPGLREQPTPPTETESTRDENGGSPYAAENLSQGGGSIGPIRGDFREWSDRMRDVEEMVGDARLRARAGAIRDRARQMRIDVKRHGKEPQWELVEEMVAEPLRELQRDVRAELLRRSASKNALVPIDRDPVPAEFTDAVKRYYENLGSAAEEMRR
ncbi:MAG: hypothetical protein AAFU85_07220, partial [Planctomycetota bacterium]